MYYEDVYNSKHHENRQLESKHHHRCYSPSHTAPDSVATWCVQYVCDNRDYSKLVTVLLFVMEH